MQPVCQLTLVGVGVCMQLLLQPLSVMKVAGIPSFEKIEKGWVMVLQLSINTNLKVTSLPTPPCSPPTSHFSLLASTRLGCT